MAAGATTSLLVNGLDVETAADPETPLLYVLRNDLGLKGTRFGCGEGLCGACSVHVNGRLTTSCNLPIGVIAVSSVTTIEGLADNETMRALRDAFLEEQAGQCGYCLSGILMAAASLLEANPTPTTSEIRTALEGNLCRCGVQNRMVRAVQRAAGARRVQA